MATNEDFDLSSLFQGPGAVLSGMLGVADNARKTVGGVMDTIASLQRAAVAVEQLVSRMNRLVDDLESPMRALTPELEKSVARIQRLSAALEGPIDRLLPGLEAAVSTFDRVALSQLPETVDEAREQLQALLDLFGEIPRRLSQLGGRSPLAALLPLGSFGSVRKPKISASSSVASPQGESPSVPVAAKVARTAKKVTTTSTSSSGVHRAKADTVGLSKKATSATKSATSATSAKSAKKS